MLLARVLVFGFVACGGASVINTAFKEFCLGRQDPGNDADWNAYLADLDKLEFERWAELGQISYERQKAELDAIRAQMGK